MYSNQMSPLKERGAPLDCASYITVSGPQDDQYSERGMSPAVIGPHEDRVEHNDLPPTDFHSKCVGAGGACSVEMGQEGVIALLLKQQEEVLKELRDQKEV